MCLSVPIIIGTDNSFSKKHIIWIKQQNRWKNTIIKSSLIIGYAAKSLTRVPDTFVILRTTLADDITLENVEVKSSYGADVEQGTGYYYYEDSAGDKTLGNCNVFYTGNQRFKITSLSKDENEPNLYWLQVKSNKGYTGYIPVKMDGAWCNSNTNYA